MRKIIPIDFLWFVFNFLNLVRNISMFSSQPPGFDICYTMAPYHFSDPQSSPFPFKVTVNKYEVRSGELIEMTLNGGPNNIPFRGFLVQAFNESGFQVGEFQLSEKSKHPCTLFYCQDFPPPYSSMPFGIGHASRDFKDEVIFNWVVPYESIGQVVVFATVVQVIDVFWERIPANEIYIV